MITSKITLFAGEAVNISLDNSFLSYHENTKNVSKRLVKVVKVCTGILSYHLPLTVTQHVNVQTVLISD